ncbi:MAG: DUF2202 domain-containing protein [Bacteroidetes bacterium]|jgi:hypothetical protein|nr:DUF2202 domain-containing protein [Bacteroidota bacterium]
MKKLLKKWSIGLILLLMISLTFSCDKAETNELPESNENTEKYDYVSAVEQAMAEQANEIDIDGLPECIAQYLDSLPFEALSDAEIATLNFVREEELLAHDVYIAMYDLYSVPVFNNISKSESFHSLLVLALMQKYGLEDIAADHQPGVYVNEEIQQYYDQLTENGSVSLDEAIIVGETIEDLDIADLIHHLESDIDNEDITFVFEQLYKGSRNHFRAFYAHINFRNLEYSPVFMSQELYDQTVSSEWEIGSGICNCP